MLYNVKTRIYVYTANNTWYHAQVPLLIFYLARGENNGRFYANAPSALHHIQREAKNANRTRHSSFIY